MSFGPAYKFASTAYNAYKLFTSGKKDVDNMRQITDNAKRGYIPGKPYAARGVRNYTTAQGSTGQFHIKKAKRKKRRFKRMSKGGRKMKRLSKKVGRLNKFLQGLTTTGVYISRQTARCIAGDNQSGFNSTTWDSSFLDTALNSARYMSPATGTIVTVDLSSDTYNRDLVVRGKQLTTFVNNYQVPCFVHLWQFKCINQTAANRTPLAIWTDWLDVNTSLTAANAQQSYVSSKIGQCPEVRKYWKIIKKERILMQPGGRATMTYNTGWFKYDYASDQANVGSTSYSKTTRDMYTLVRVEGSLGHDGTAATDLQGFLSAGVDWMTVTEVGFKYAGGYPAVFWTVADGADTMALPVCSNQAVADNQGYSLG